MAHPSELAAAGTVFLVAAIAATLAWIAFLAARRNESRSLRFVAAAFVLFTVKELVVGVALLTDVIHHQHLEVVSALFDLAIVGLLIWPIVR